MPVVPSIEIPPITPTFALAVCLAISSPFVTDTVQNIFIFSKSLTFSLNILCIFSNGTGFIAGKLGWIFKPFFVTTPTPSPA